MNWSASNYTKRKAQRDKQKPATWVQNPETGEWFYLRKVGAMASLVAGMLPSSLTGYAIGQWQDQGIDLSDSDDAHIDPVKTSEDAFRDVRMMANTIAKACVIPLLLPAGQSHPATFDADWTEMVCTALAEKYPDFKRTDFNPEAIMLDAEDLDESDVMFIFKYASGQVGQVDLQGGGAMNVAGLKIAPKKPARGTGASVAQQKFRKSA